MSLLANLRILLPFIILGVVEAKPMVAPTADARRLEVLFFGAPTENGPHHDPITRYRALKKGLGIDGINLTYCEEPAKAFTKDYLEHFDAVLMYANWNQNEPMPADQLAALLGYVENGGGFVPVHCASACYGGSPEFIKLVGARFKSHGGEEFQVKNLKPNHPILKDLKGYKADVKEPLFFDFLGVRVVTMPPPSAGGPARGEQCDDFFRQRRGRLEQYERFGKRR